MHTFHFSNKSASNTITSLEKILNSSDEIDSQTGYPNHNKMLLCGNTLLTYLNETHTKGAFAAIEILNVQKSGLYCGGASQSKNTWKRILDIVSECLPKNAYLGRVTLGIAIHVWGDEIEKKFERILKRITLTLESLEVESVVTKENVPLYISSHIGYLIYPDDCGIQEDTYYNITRFVALSAYTYKSVEIASSIQRYEKKLSEQLIQKIQIESKLFPSILNGDFKFFFQPQLNLKTNKIVGAEMLCRWEDAGLEKEKTMEYIEILENSKYIINFTYVSFEKYMHFLQKHHEKLPENFRLSYNLSPAVFRWSSFDLIEMVESALHNNQALAKFMQFEITESSYFSKLLFHEVIIAFQTIKDKGIKISIDDFGSGYSSLSLLTSNIPDTIKIDKELSKKICDTKNDKHSFINSLIFAAKRSNLNVIAEGIETDNELKAIEEAGIELIQGYWLSKPINEKAFLAFLQEH